MAASKTKLRAAARARPRKANGRFMKGGARPKRRQYARAGRPRHNAHHHHRAASRPRRRNPVKAAPRRRRHRNPSIITGVTGLFEGALTAVIGMGVTNWVYSLVAGFVPASPLVGIGVKLGIAWGVGEAAKKFGFSRHANLLAIGGAVSAGQDALAFAFGGGGLFAPAPTQVATRPGQALVPAQMTADDGGGMSDLVYAPAGYGTLGDLVNAPNAPWLYQ